MAPSIDPSLPPSDHINADVETTITGPDVEGALPRGLSGRLLGIGPDSNADQLAFRPVGAGDGMVHSVHLHAGRAVSYRSRRVRTDIVARRLGVALSPGPSHTGPDVVASNIVVLGGSILAFGDGSLAYELNADLDTLRRVDLAGQSRGLSASPKLDPATGDLHLLARDANGVQAHVVVPCGALTRRSRPIDGAPNPVKDLAVTSDSVVLVADGFVGVMSRDGEEPVTWIATGVDAPSLIHAHEVGETVVVLAVTPSLERWTLHAASATVDRELLDPTPRHFARINDHQVDEVPRFLWTVTDGTVDKHDLATEGRVQHSFGPRQPGDLAFVTDPTRASDPDGGWLVGFAHHASLDETELVVLDAADITVPPIATVRIARRTPLGLHSTWIASTHRRTTTQGDRS